MIGSGRCHGPGCQQAALAPGGFCSEDCQARWHGQFDEDKGSTTEPVAMMAPGGDPIGALQSAVGLVDSPLSLPEVIMLCGVPVKLVANVRTRPRIKPPGRGE